MKIITVGPGINNKYARFFYAMDRKIRNGLIRLGHDVTHVSDRDIASNALGPRLLGKRLANNKLLEVADAIHPDYLILFQAHIINPKTLFTLKKKLPNCKIANIDNDLMYTEARFQRLLNLKKSIDVTFITSAGEHLARLRREGLHIFYLPNCTDSSIEEGNPLDDINLSYDFVYFAGDVIQSPRWKLPLEIASIAPDIKCGFFGYGKTRIFGSNYFQILKTSKIALNWSMINDLHLYSSDRISQLFGTGRCVCLYAGSGFQRFINEGEAIFFTDANDLVRKIRTALHEDKWRQIAQKGQQCYRILFNEKRVAQYIINVAFDIDISKYEWCDI
ncbi:MAG: hypothetical protein TECD_00216 [Hyphomicrobiaceae bacterium hypho_1]